MKLSKQLLVLVLLLIHSKGIYCENTLHVLKMTRVHEVTSASDAKYLGKSSFYYTKGKLIWKRSYLNIIFIENEKMLIYLFPGLRKYMTVKPLSESHKTLPKNYLIIDQHLIQTNKIKVINDYKSQIWYAVCINNENNGYSTTFSQYAYTKEINVPEVYKSFDKLLQMLLIPNEGVRNRQNEPSEFLVWSKYIEFDQDLNILSKGKYYLSEIKEVTVPSDFFNIPDGYKEVEWDESLFSNPF